MRHFLAYGNSDQASFRDASVRASFDFLTVPGTIAAFYPDATAGFVLTSDLPYIIDPRTPLFQGTIAQPKASHYVLAETLGKAVRRVLGDDELRSPASFSADVYTPNAIADLVTSFVRFQRDYGSRSGEIQEKLSRYRDLLSEALGRATQAPELSERRGPAFLLVPYFAVSSYQDRWWDVTQAIWDVAAGLDEPNNLSPVIATTSADFFQDAVTQLPTDLSTTAFYWVTGFDERTAPEDQLQSMWGGVTRVKPLSLVNLYGGFFSICLHHAGLWGFNNGLGYSESRSWPALPATGAAPARYYLRDLHLFVAPAVAQLVIDTDPELACSCEVCQPGSGPRSLVSLSYHELKKHFALSRRHEISLVESSSATEIADGLEEVSRRFENVLSRLPARISIRTGHMHRWAAVLRDAT